MGQGQAISLSPFYSLLPWAVVRFGPVLGLRTGESHCFLLSVSDYVSAYAGRSACFSLKLFRLNSNRKKWDVIVYTNFSKLFTVDFGPTDTHNSSCLLPFCSCFLRISVFYNPGKVGKLISKQDIGTCCSKSICITLI